MTTPTTREALAEPTAEMIALARKMAKAAGQQTPATMAGACYMLLCTAAMVGSPDAYFDWLDRMDKEPAR